MATRVVTANPAVGAAIDLDCPDFSTQSRAETVHDSDPSAPQRLDRHSDGSPVSPLVQRHLLLGAAGRDGDRSGRHGRSQAEALPAFALAA